MLVTLTEEEWKFAANRGLNFYWRAQRNKMRDQIGMDPVNNLSFHIFGAVGEFAFAKAFSYKWDTSMNVFKGADVGSEYQVRTTTYANSPHLMMQERDDPEYIYILACVKLQEVHLRGWCHGYEGKLDCFKQTHIRGKPLPKENYAIPAKQLRKMMELIRYDKRRVS